MRTLVAVSLAGLLVLLLPTVASSQEGPASFRAHAAHVFSNPGGQALTLPSQASPPAVVAAFLRGEGVGDDTVASLVIERESSVGRTGLTHLRFRQQFAGLTVFGAYVKATVNSNGQLVHLIEALATPAGDMARAAIGPRQALEASLAELHPDSGAAVIEAGRSGNTVVFAGGDFFYRNPQVTRMAIAMESGALQEGFLVETWSRTGNLLHHTLVGPSGNVLNVELRTNNDRYNIFPDHPGYSAQIIASGPGAGNAESPDGWLHSGKQKSIDISGNNVQAYLDARRNNRPDKGGANINDANFLAQADLTDQPYTSQNQSVAVQNLFYFNNIIHDKLYRHGFDEAAGNFQEDNFGNGGLGSDSVNAEAQDGAGVDNANFATPSDGSNPRMQMFLWNGEADHLVVFSDSSYLFASGANFGGSLQNNPLTGPVVEAVDGGISTTDGCEPLANGLEIAGSLALIDRGNCDFDVKVKNAQVAGAAGAIIVNNQGDGLVVMGGDDTTVTVPAVFIGQSDGASLRTMLLETVTLQENPNGALARDGDLDSDIIYHEYGHGLTWRMIGSMSGAMSGAIGEGMGDVLSILMNDDDVVGEYSTGNAIGIRSAPYTGYLRTYGQFTGDSVHFDGEIYAATIWRLWNLFQNELPPIFQDTLFGYLIGGMNYTPAGPAFEDMRDGILTAVNIIEPVSVTASEHSCLIWEAFAHYGIGVGAQYAGGIVTPSTDMPVECGGTNPGNNPAQVVTPSDLSVNEAGAAYITANELLATDADNPDTQTLVFTVTNAPLHGTLLPATFTQADLDAGNVVAYQHDGSETLTDSFGVSVTDGISGIDPATVSITVAPVDDPPVADDQSVSTAPETPVDITLTATDPDGGAQSFAILEGPPNGTLTGTAPNMVYTPKPGTTDDSFQFTVNGTSVGTVTITVATMPVDDPALHIGDLDAVSTSNGSTWTAKVTITVHAGGEPVAGATVLGDWGDAPGAGNGDCSLTNALGQCTVTYAGIRKRARSALFTVNDVIKTGELAYEPTVNHDPDGDSTGSYIIILKP